MRKIDSIWIVVVLFSLAFVTEYSAAHSEAEKARFVSITGNDIGLCNNRFRPCKSIAYAVQQANKGDKILVAEGSYTVDSAETLVYLLSELQPILGGYNVTDNYQTQAPDQFITHLIDVPYEHMDTLYQKGFHIIGDQKGSLLSSFFSKPNNEVTGSVSEGLDAIKRTQSVQSASPCIDGRSAGFECRDISLLGRVSLSALNTGSSAANDIWGFVDLNTMKEYALLGLRNGIAAIDVSDPENPVMSGFIAGQSSIWRDIKVLQYYDEQTKRFKAIAYAGADNVSEGLSIIDLSELPERISLLSRDLRDRQSHNVYMSNVDYTTNTALNNQSPLLHVTGSQNFGGAWRTYSLDDPAKPEARYTKQNALRSDYTHDASSILIEDSRVDSGCGLGSQTTCNVIIDFNEKQVRLFEHNGADSARELSQFTYPNLDYVHSGWWSEDKQYIFVHDELDERTFSINTTLNIFDISDLQAPQLVATWRGPTKATDHNGFVNGNKYYMSNYEKGLTVLDIENPTAPLEIANFDTFGASNNTSFNGAWGVFPFLPSGNIIVSDVQGGLYVLQDNTIKPEHSAVRFANNQALVQEGDIYRLEVQKQGLGAMSVDYDVLLPSANAEDIEFEKGSLQWGNNDSESQFIDITINNDNLDEFDEMLVVTLQNAKQGHIDNSRSNAFITIDGTAINTGQLSFESSELSVLETQGSVDIRVTRQFGSESALRVLINVQSDTATEGEDYILSNNTVELNWADGELSTKTFQLTIVNDELSESIERLVLSIQAGDNLDLGENQSLSVSIKDDESNTPPQVSAGSNSQANTRQTVTLIGAMASDAQSDLSLQWSQVSGAQVDLQNANTLSPRFVAPSVAGTLVFQLQATDEFGVSATANVSVNIVAPQPTGSQGGSSGSGGSLSFWGLCFLAAIIGLRKRAW